MGISPENFLNRYFTSEQLKAPLSDIGFSVGGTKSERIKRIVENWTVHNRDWYELLDFLDWGELIQICDDFNISYSKYNKEETLCSKIENEQVLNFRNKTMQSSKKESSINIQAKNINIGSNNKMSHTSESKNSSISKVQLIVAIIVGIFVVFGVVSGFTLTNDSTKNEFSPNRRINN